MRARRNGKAMNASDNSALQAASASKLDAASRPSWVPVTVVRSAKAGDGDTILIDTFGTHDVAPLSGGCLCCTVRIKLQGALRDLLAERERRPFS